jgi:hypothetical protein
MAVLNVQKSQSDAGLVTTYGAAAAGGDSFANDGHTVFIVKNGGGSACVVTVNAPTKCNHGFEHDVVVSVAAGATAQIGPFSPQRFNNLTGLVDVTYNQVTTVTVAAVTLGL